MKKYLTVNGLAFPADSMSHNFHPAAGSFLAVASLGERGGGPPQVTPSRGG